jgi:CTP:molybdopterin cytidylyltransferase MocA/SAM-dependent methyltransferase
VSSGPTAIVLAAGSGSRFGGGKLLARLEGVPILQHVLDALANAGIDDPVVVLGGDGPALEATIEWRAARRISNPEPARGLSSSLQLGWATVMADGPRPESVLVVLGDQPRLDPAVVRALANQPLDPARPIVVARHADGARNPVRLEPEAAALVTAASGDRGLGPLLEGRPELVRWIDVEASNPDIDARADLVAVLAGAWARRVRDNAAQVDRFREAPDGRDFYRSVSRLFVADPAREGDPVLDLLVAEARPGETWLDIGAGAGRYALPLARRLERVVAIDPSTSMLDALREGAAAAGIANIEIHEGRWPPPPELRAALGSWPLADVALIAHVGYDVADILPFLDAMEASARRLCIAVLMDRSPATVAAPFWPLVHGEERVPLPARGELVELLQARGAAPAVATVMAERRTWGEREEVLGFLRRQLWTTPGSSADRRLTDAFDRLASVDPDGSISFPAGPALDIGIVRWGPSDQGGA